MPKLHGKPQCCYCGEMYCMQNCMSRWLLRITLRIRQNVCSRSRSCCMNCQSTTLRHFSSLRNIWT